MFSGARIAIIACEVFRAELEYLEKKLQLSYPTHYLEQGLHDTPEELTRLLAKTIAELESAATPPDYIILAYGLCGKALTGITALQATLILPKVHDCIPLLLGIPQAEKDARSGHEATYWSSPGWLKYSHVPFIEERENRFRKYREQFDEDAAQYLIDLEFSWNANYTYYTFIHWQEEEGFPAPPFAEAEEMAKTIGLTYGTTAGKSCFIRKLLTEADDETLFLHLPPGSTPDMTATGEVVARTLTPEA